MEICHYASLIYADYCCFFSIGNIEPFWTYVNFSWWENVHVHPPLPPFMDEVLSEEIVKKTINFSGGNFPGESLMAVNFPSRNFARGNFPKT